MESPAELISHLTDQKRRNVLGPGLAATQLQPPGPGDREDVTVGVGYEHRLDGGYDMIAGIIVSDQPFTVQIYQGADQVNLPEDETWTAVLTPSGLYRVRLRWPIFGEWVRAVVVNTGPLATTKYSRAIAVLPVNQFLPGFYPDKPINVNVELTGEATDGDSRRIVTVVSTVGDLVPANTLRQSFEVFNLGRTTVFIKPITTTSPGDPTVNDFPVVVGGSFKGEEMAHFRWKYIDNGLVCDLRVLEAYK
jgi:hypothetical protein